MCLRRRSGLSCTRHLQRLGWRRLVASARGSGGGGGDVSAVALHHYRWFCGRASGQRTGIVRLTKGCPRVFTLTALRYVDATLQRVLGLFGEPGLEHQHRSLWPLLLCAPVSAHTRLEVGRRRTLALQRLSTAATPLPVVPAGCAASVLRFPAQQQGTAPALACTRACAYSPPQASRTPTRCCRQRMGAPCAAGSSPTARSRWSRWRPPSRCSSLRCGAFRLTKF